MTEGAGTTVTLRFIPESGTYCRETTFFTDSALTEKGQERLVRALKKAIRRNDMYRFPGRFSAEREKKTLRERVFRLRRNSNT